MTETSNTNATYEAVKDHVSRFRLEDFGQYITDWQNAPNGEGMPECVKHAIEDELDGRAWYCARLLDRVKGTDPLKRTPNSPAYGTPNRRSITYKVRKALGYSYP